MKRIRIFSIILTTVLAFVFIPTIIRAKDMTAKDLIEEARKHITSITVEEAKSMLGKTGVIILDVREPKEFKKGHLPGSINIPRGLLEFKIDKKVPDKNTTILIYCKKGGRACLSAHNLVKMGYNKVKNIKGGWLAWTKAGYPVE